MSFRNYTKEFFVDASMRAKHARMKELNAVETDLIIADDLLQKLIKSGTIKENTQLTHLETQIRRIRVLIKEKKIKILY